ncbi:spore germination protein [Ureibacillus thermophilus]|uniref:Spore germination protein n=1 Tax=Ureibacillus thermophilus TaxID=367743 RepID=A0A4P6URC6_9BACL|nr:spore germination protein [Ureibacillus thermophilus]QBK25127.1 spore germination protein [Ureibacillus thermophilus]
MSSKEILSWIMNQFNDTVELTYKPLELDNKKITVLYIKSLIDQELFQKYILQPFFEIDSEEKLQVYLMALPQFQEVPSKEEGLLYVMEGNVLVEIQENLYAIDFKLSKNSDVNSTSVETTIHGSELALSDNLMTNINIIRSFYHEPSLTIEYFLKGEVNKPKVAVIYDQEKVKTTALEMIKEKLKEIDKQVITESPQFSNFLNQKRFSLFPQMLLTERPDRIVYNLAGGKIVLLVDGSPQCMMAPVVFFDFMTTMEDNYHTFVISNYLKLLRYLGIFVCLLLPGIYIGAASFSPEVFRTEFMLTIAGSRMGVPFTSFVEVLFMLFFMELLLEASIRLPKAISATAATVGGLILGTAVTEAALASSIMVIIVSAVAISTFVIPVNEMAFAIRIVRLLLIVVASIFGLAGLTLGFLCLVMYLVNQTSFGEPFLRVYNYRKENKKSEGEA